MKQLILMAAIAAAGCLAQAHGETTRVCPRYSCTAEAVGTVDYHRPRIGFGKGDDLAVAKADAIRSCIDTTYGSDCAIVTCEKFTGPVIPLIPCKSQW